MVYGLIIYNTYCLYIHLPHLSYNPGPHGFPLLDTLDSKKNQNPLNEDFILKFKLFRIASQ